MQHHITADEVPLLWTQPPRFIEMMRSNNNTASSSFQHPHYFWYQSDKLTVLLNQLATANTSTTSSSFSQDDYFNQAREILTQLLCESQGFSGLTREQLRQLEPNVRTFVNKVQNVDGLVQEWEMRRQLQQQQQQQQQQQEMAMAMTMAAVPEPVVSRKRGRDEDEEENNTVSSFGAVKRRRESCGAQQQQWMDVEAAYAAVPFIMDSSPWMNQAPPAQQPVMWSESFYS